VALRSGQRHRQARHHRLSGQGQLQRQEVEENWIRILNVYVDAFGEWQIGSQQPVKSRTVRHIPTG